MFLYRYQNVRKSSIAGIRSPVLIESKIWFCSVRCGITSLLYCVFTCTHCFDSFLFCKSQHCSQSVSHTDACLTIRGSKGSALGCEGLDLRMEQS